MWLSILRWTLSWIYPVSNKYNHKRWRRFDTDERSGCTLNGEYRGDMEAGIGVMHPLARNARRGTRCWEKLRNDSLLEFGEGAQVWWHLNFAPRIQVLVFWAPELWENKIAWFYTTQFVIICYRSQIKLIHLSLLWFLQL